MKKLLKKLLIPVILLTFIITSCNVADDGDVMKTNSKNKASIVNSDIEMTEGGTAIIEISVDKASNVPLIYKLRQVDGNGIMDVDFEFAEKSAADYGEIGGKIVIPAYQTTGTVEVTSLADYFSSEDKSASFVLESMESMNGLADGSVNISINNVGPSEIISKLSWDITKSGDIDYYIINPAFDDIVGAGESADMPEIVSAISPSDPDGEYTIWMHAYGVTDGVENFDLNWDFSRPDGVIDNLEMNYDYANQDNTYTNIDIGILVYKVITIEKTGSNFTISLAN